MNKKLTLIGGIGLGAGLMYLFDPDRGKRRRARLRDKAAHGARVVSNAIDKTSRDLGNRVDGLIARVESLFTCKETSDTVLAARVRSKIGRVISHPKAIEVKAEQGRVRLSGPVWASEVERLLSCVASVPGVKEVINSLEAHASAEHISALQGGRERTGKRFALMKVNWSPTARLFAGAAGGLLAAYSARKRGVLGAVTGVAGVGLLSRAVTNMELARLVGIGGSRAISVQKAINIAAPVEEVFEFWKHHENFPSFMSNVRELKETGEGRYHWTVSGPAGISIEWDGRITRLIPNEMIEWESLPGSAVEQKGIVRFKPVAECETSVDIKMTYNPPAGAVGHLVALLFGSDPKSEMDEDLMRMKSLIETGRVPHDAARKQAKVGEASAG
ncbi:MAG: SRPBCC family protein [Acidobacteriota bacterium]